MATLKGVGQHDLADPRAILALLGIKPWRNEDIDLYMKNQVANYRGNFAWRLRKHIPAEAIKDLLGMGGALSLIASFVCGFIWLCCAVVGQSAAVEGLGDIALTSGLILLAFILFAIWDMSITVDGVRWVDLSLDKAAPLPVFVENIKSKVEELFPGCFFTVAELRQTRTWGLIDPILYAHIPAGEGPPRWKKVPVVVWDENNIEVPPPH